MSPFALINETKQFFDKTVVLSGSLSIWCDGVRSIASLPSVADIVATLGGEYAAAKERL